jgi:protein-S-isoprenylcysteine O-methyltransferase Ste14
MRTIATVEILLCWIVWWYPPLFRAPHWQKRASITVAGPSRLGLLLESLAYAAALVLHLPASAPPGTWRLVAAMIPGPVAVVLFWSAVDHLGKQFRIQAGLYHDHELVRTGAYRFVRHPIYASMLALLVAMLLLRTSWLGMVVSLALFFAGTEIRVRTEEALLASRFPAEFAEYRRQVPAYLPFVR